MYEDATGKLGDEDSGELMLSLMPSGATMIILDLRDRFLCAWNSF